MQGTELLLLLILLLKIQIFITQLIKVFTEQVKFLFYRLKMALREIRKKVGSSKNWFAKKKKKNKKNMNNSNKKFTRILYIFQTKTSDVTIFFYYIFSLQCPEASYFPFNLQRQVS